MSAAALRITTGSRLHFGLLSWGKAGARQFGGLGLMVENPGLEITVEPGQGRIEGPLRDRVAALADQVRAAGFDLPAFDLAITQAPPEHVGLGTGTQVSLAVARLLMHYADAPASATDTTALARLTGRGLRSGVGLHGFAHGGLIVDGGRKGDDGSPPLLSRLAFPEDWCVLIVLPKGPPGLHGKDERRAFGTLPPFSPTTTDRLCRRVLLELLPAVIERDLAAFGTALEAIQLDVGEAFAPAQGGAFAHPQFEAIASTLREHGLVGIGQSSWGPVMYGFHDQAIATVLEALADRFGLDASQAFWTRARNKPAELVTISR